MTFSEGKKNKKHTQVITKSTADDSGTPGVVFKKSNVYQEIYTAKTQGEPKLAQKVLEFIISKTDNPMQPFGRNDKPFLSAGHIRNAVPGETLLHAHLDRDSSMVYSINGRDPTVIKLYGIFNHADLGTGDTPNIRRQQSVAQQLNNMRFD